MQSKSRNTNGVNADKPVMVPSIKTQGIKTRLMKFIMDGVEWDGSQTVQYGAEGGIRTHEPLRERIAH